MPAPRRSHLRLHAAILELAAERSPAELSVTEIAQKAGVHRSTYYEHADSPEALLAAALRTELDEIRDTHLTDGALPVAAATQATTLAVLEHVERHEAIYRRGLRDEDSSGLRALLAAHFRDSVRLLEADGYYRPPFDTAPEHRAFAIDATARYIAGGAVGLLAAWLETPSPRDPDLYIVAQTALTAAAIDMPDRT